MASVPDASGIYADISSGFKKLTVNGEKRKEKKKAGQLRISSDSRNIFLCGVIHMFY